jgi:hypothetical protein
MTDTSKGIQIRLTPELLKGLADLGITITIDRAEALSWDLPTDLLGTAKQASHE